MTWNEIKSKNGKEIENVVKAVCKVSGCGLLQGWKGGFLKSRRRSSEPSFKNDKKKGITVRYNSCLL